ncbi:hypothetical protein BRC96_10485 [Halobacteriales archaeon QS_6_64_34]|nr:MAG: hypothetical protein BRC96_10485 [Halobacteriales archaeon QS_6_64_34]
MSDPYDSIQKSAAESNATEVEVRRQSLSLALHTTLQRVASECSEYDGHAGNDTGIALRDRLAVLGFFVGPVGDATLYRRVDGETEPVLTSETTPETTVDAYRREILGEREDGSLILGEREEL